jgi:hypothetical protein
VKTNKFVFKIKNAFFTLMNKNSNFKLNLYGNGHAAEIAANFISLY